ncbi:cyclin-L1 [Halteromyces radiatus]|uniref:cyclin-L1 n=1 Tax=Halteromyces radiatus TaxID=101107 RepID=UPI00221FC15D|nr:cyclin-L1 [Halteromyces radiatus]KAI8093431.1 cyclin-L1 [Halteromyces radiatus]
MSRVLENPLASLDQLTCTPSQHDNIPEQLEDDLRNFGAELIQSAGILLKLPQVAMATAQVLFQRFFFMASLKNFDIIEIGMGALFLASKVEESTIRMTHLITVYDHLIRLAQKRSTSSPLDAFSQRAYDLKAKTITAEMYILKQLGFNVQVQLPYSLMINYLRILGLEDHESVPTRAWNYLNDSLRTILHVAYTPQVIAVTSIWLSCRDEHIKLPIDPGHEWWLLFDVKENDIKTAAARIRRLYYQPLDRENLPLTIQQVKDWIL